MYLGVKEVRKLLSSTHDHDLPIGAFIEKGAVPLLINLLKREDDPKVQFEAAWALSNIASGCSVETQVVVDAGAVPLVIMLLSSPDADVREKAICFLGNVVRTVWVCVPCLFFFPFPLRLSLTLL